MPTLLISVTGSALNQMQTAMAEVLGIANKQGLKTRMQLRKTKFGKERIFTTTLSVFNAQTRFATSLLKTLQNHSNLRWELRYI